MQENEEYSCGELPCLGKMLGYCQWAEIIDHNRQDGAWLKYVWVSYLWKIAIMSETECKFPEQIIAAASEGPEYIDESLAK